MYNHFIDAIQSSFFFFLGESGMYVQMGANRFVSTSLEYEYEPHEVEEFCLRVQWLCCGTLTVLASPTRAFNIKGLLGHDRHESKGTSVRLAPFGQTATLAQNFRPATDLSHRHASRDELTRRSSLLSLLACRGLKLPGDCKWVKIQVRKLAVAHSLLI